MSVPGETIGAHLRAARSALWWVLALMAGAIVGGLAMATLGHEFVPFTGMDAATCDRVRCVVGAGVGMLVALIGKFSIR